MIRVAYNTSTLRLDAVHDGKGFVMDDGLESPIVFSLFTD